MIIGVKRSRYIRLPEQAGAARIDVGGSPTRSAIDALRLVCASDRRSNAVACHRAREPPLQAARTLWSTDFVAARERRQLAGRCAQAPARLAPASSVLVGSFTPNRTSPTCSHRFQMRVLVRAFFAFFWRIAGGPYTRHPASDAPSEACADAARAPRPRPTNRLCRAGPDGSTEDAFRPHHLPTLSCMTLSPGLRRPFCTCAEPRARGTIRAARAARAAASAASHSARKARQAARRAKWRFRPWQRGDASHRPCISISGR